MSDATPENQSIDGEIREDAYIYALDQLAKGTKLHNIRECLIEAGYTPDEAEQIIQHAMDDRKKHAHELKVRVTRGGFQLIVGGLGLWLLSYYFRDAGARGWIALLIFLGMDIMGLVFVIKGGFRVIRRLLAMTR